MHFAYIMQTLAFWDRGGGVGWVGWMDGRRGVWVITYGVVCFYEPYAVFAQCMMFEYDIYRN